MAVIKRDTTSSAETPELIRQNQFPNVRCGPGGYGLTDLADLYRTSQCRNTMYEQVIVSY